MMFLAEQDKMDISVTLIIFLIINAVVIRSQEYIGDAELPKEDFGLNPDDFAKITDADIRLLLQTMDTQREGSRIHESRQYCQSFQSCLECVKSMWYPCDWCHDYGCTDKSHTLCPFSSKEVSNNPRNASSCPYIHSKNPILVPSGIKKHIEVKISVPDPALLEKDVICQINLKDQMTHLKGIILKNVVYCFPLKLVITDDSQVGSFSILWGGVQPLSNEIPLLAYRCDAMANDCEDCRLLPQEYDCGWCEDTQMCALPDKCNDLLSWSLNRMTCQLNIRQMYFV